jgi:hypothetical protein
MKTYVIERDLPGVGGLNTEQLAGAAKSSNAALATIPGVEWDHSYVAGDKTFCIYRAESEEKIHEHAAKSGFPATKITEVVTVIDPGTEHACAA